MRFLACPEKQAKIDEAIEDVQKIKWGYFAELKFIGAQPSGDRLVEAEASMKAINDLRFKE